MSKYKSQKITVDGIVFDSKDEAKYYEYLKKMKALGKIENFELQPEYELIPKFKKQGQAFRRTTYTPDFLIYHKATRIRWKAFEFVFHSYKNY